MDERSRASRIRAQIGLFFVGAVAGTVGDQIHVQFGVLRYRAPETWLFGQAMWVPVLFGFAGLALVNGEALFDGMRPRGEPRPSRAGNLVPMALFYLAYLSTGLFQDSPWLLAAALTVAWALRVARRPSRDRVVGALAVAAGGCLFEAALSSTGAFTYREPDFLLVPAWLAPLYFHVSLMTRDIHLAWFAPGAATAGAAGNEKAAVAQPP